MKKSKKFLCSGIAMVIISTFFLCFQTFGEVNAATYGTTTISYNANGGSGAPSSHSVQKNASGVANFTLSTVRPTRAGYAFQGWRLSNSTAYGIDQPGQSIAYATGTTTSTTLTYYAQWATLGTTTISYNANSGNGAPNSHSVQKNASGVVNFTLSTVQPTRAGYAFQGWRLSNSTAYGIDQPGQSIAYATGSATTNTTLTYYAQWQLIPMKQMTFNHYYDSAFVSRYFGNNGVTASNTISAYQQIITNYFMEVFQLSINVNVNSYTSPGDQCTHLAGYTCTKALTTTCEYSAQYHCTNNAKMLFTRVAGAPQNSQTIREIKWTGYNDCEHCPVGGHTDSIGGVAGGDQVLVHWGSEYNSSKQELGVGTISHEIGHTFGCGHDGHTNNTCVMKYGVSDSVKYTMLQNKNPEAYCSACRNIINNYIQTQLPNP